VKEPVVSDGFDGISDPLVGDLCVRGVWQPQTEALFDIRVVNTDARSYCGCTPQLCCVLLKLRRNGSTHWPVRVVVHPSLPFVCLWMICLRLRQTILRGDLGTIFQ